MQGKIIRSSFFFLLSAAVAVAHMALQDFLQAVKRSRHQTEKSFNIGLHLFNIGLHPEHASSYFFQILLDPLKAVVDTLFFFGCHLLSPRLHPRYQMKPPTPTIT